MDPQELSIPVTPENVAIEMKQEKETKSTARSLVQNLREEEETPAPTPLPQNEGGTRGGRNSYYPQESLVESEDPDDDNDQQRPESKDCIESFGIKRFFYLIFALLAVGILLTILLTLYSGDDDEQAEVPASQKVLVSEDIIIPTENLEEAKQPQNITIEVPVAQESENETENALEEQQNETNHTLEIQQQKLQLAQ